MRQKQKAEAFGRVAEMLCVIYLLAKGYRILERNFRTWNGEIDIIAKRGRTVAYIEVKARKNNTDLSFFRARQRRRIERAATLFAANHPALARHDTRFDLIVVSPYRLPTHVKNAWRVAD